VKPGSRNLPPLPQVFEQLFQAYEQKMPVPGMKEFDQLVRQELRKRNRRRNAENIKSPSAAHMIFLSEPVLPAAARQSQLEAHPA